MRRARGGARPWAGAVARGNAQGRPRFWRADDSATASVGGFGLGLTIARSYARDMGGDLTVAAREGGGTVFTLELKEAGNG